MRKKQSQFLKKLQLLTKLRKLIVLTFIPQTAINSVRLVIVIWTGHDGLLPRGLKAV